MKKILFTIVGLLVILAAYYYFSETHYRTENIKKPDEATENKIETIYSDAKLRNAIPFELFRMAMIGFYNIGNIRKKDRIAIIDYSKPSTSERFYVVDLNKKKLLYKCLVAHGINSGGNYATEFSNEIGSNKSSLGYFVTKDKYPSQKHGFSLRLDGIEKGINDNARERYIVMHKSKYVSRWAIFNNCKKLNWRLWRSEGCPALPVELSYEIINSIKDGRCLFIYGDDSEYVEKSKIL